MEEAKLTAVCDIDGKNAEASTKKCGAEQLFINYKEIFEKDKLDAVVITTPNNVHRNQAIVAEKFGVHILIEKPMTVTNKEAWDVVGACRKNGVKLMVGCDRRFWIHNQWAKNLIDEGVIGKCLISRAYLHEHWCN